MNEHRYWELFRTGQISLQAYNMLLEKANSQNYQGRVNYVDNAKLPKVNSKGYGKIIRYSKIG